MLEVPLATVAVPFSLRTDPNRPVSAARSSPSAHARTEVRGSDGRPPPDPDRAEDLGSRYRCPLQGLSQTTVAAPVPCLLPRALLSARARNHVSSSASTHAGSLAGSGRSLRGAPRSFDVPPGLSPSRRIGHPLLRFSRFATSFGLSRRAPGQSADRCSATATTSTASFAAPTSWAPKTASRPPDDALEATRAKRAE